MTINAGTSTDVFLAFVEQQLIPNLSKEDVVVMDNLSAHRSPSVMGALKEHQADVLFTPPYSPEFNPIEKTWAKLKETIRRAKTLTRKTFDDAVAVAMAAITTNNISAWVAHCGYRLR
jgi:transposase